MIGFFNWKANFGYIHMDKFLVQDTPGKVMAFLGASLFSMALLFSVSLSNASFQGMEYSLPNPFAPEKVALAIDTVAASYSNAVAGFTAPARQAVAIHTAEIKWVFNEASVPLTKALGLNAQPRARVAGAFTQNKQSFAVKGSYEPLSVDDIYAALIGN